MDMTEVLAETPALATIAANLTVTFDGLALCCFNKDNKLWEMAFLRPAYPYHELKVEIFNSTGQPVCAPIPLERARKIELRYEANDHYNNFPNGGVVGQNFHRLANTGVNEDLRWVIDLQDRSDAKHTFEKLREKAEFTADVGITMLELPFAVLYTKEKTSDELFLAPYNAAQPGDPQYKIGRVNELAAGAVECKADTTIQIVVDGTLKCGPLPVNAGPYTIAFSNLDPPYGAIPTPGTLVTGDFALFYHVIQVTSGTEHQIWGPAKDPSTSRAKTMASFRTDCDIHRLGRITTFPSSWKV
jgi:hypothetical protein